MPRSRLSIRSSRTNNWVHDPKINHRRHRFVNPFAGLVKSLKAFFQRIVERLKILAVFVLLIVVFWSILNQVSPIFTIKKITISGWPENKILKGVGQVKGQYIFLVTEKEMEQDIEKENPEVTSVFVSKKLPDELQISVIYTEPMVILVANNGYLYLSDQGRVIYKTRKVGEELPYIDYYQKIDYSSTQAGDVFNYKDLQASLNFLRHVLDLGLAVDTIDINGLNMIGFNLKGKTILFTTEKDEEIQLYELGQIVHSFKIEGKDFKSLDLRFDKPVVVLNN